MFIVYTDDLLAKIMSILMGLKHLESNLPRPGHKKVPHSTGPGGGHLFLPRAGHLFMPRGTLYAPAGATFCAPVGAPFDAPVGAHF